MKDILGREVHVGNYIAYAQVAGRSANMAIYNVIAIVGDYHGTIKATKLVESYGDYAPSRMCTLTSGKVIPWRYATHTKDVWKLIEMTPEEKDAVDNKTFTLKIGERIIILDNFTPDVVK